MTASGEFTEDHPSWKEAYRHEILRQAGLKEEDELGGIEALGELAKRYEAAGNSCEGLKEFLMWNMEQVYKKNRIATTKQRLRKRLTDMKRERTDRYHEMIRRIITDYHNQKKEEDIQSDLEDEQEKEEEAPKEQFRVACKSPHKSPQKSPRPPSNPTQ